MPVKKREYPLEKFVGGLVSRLIRSYKLEENQREDLTQDAWVTVLRVQKEHPKKATNKGYLYRAIVNDLIKIEQKDRPRRNASKPLTKDYAEVDIDASTRLLVDDLLDRANLTPSEQQIITMAYGLDGYTIPLHPRSIARELGLPCEIITQKLFGAKLKLGILPK
jgi:DNA-directed RNA polymerase specialized sigma24 family protein